MVTTRRQSYDALSPRVHDRFTYQTTSIRDVTPDIPRMNERLGRREHDPRILVGYYHRKLDKRRTRARQNEEKLLHSLRTMWALYVRGTQSTLSRRERGDDADKYSIQPPAGPVRRSPQFISTPVQPVGADVPSKRSIFYRGRLNPSFTEKRTIRFQGRRSSNLTTRPIPSHRQHSDPQPLLPTIEDLGITILPSLGDGDRIRRLSE